MKIPHLNTAVAATILIAAGLMFGAGTLRAPFVFDDIPSIAGNPTLDSLSGAWFPPPNVTTTGRPLLNFSFALNRLVSGNDTWSYHAGNLIIHVLAGLVLWGLVRRSLAAQPTAGGLPQGNAEAASLLAAALWMLHPLQTESVTYVVQRAESLAGLLHLFVIYSVARSAEATRSLRWQACAVGACLLGVATKETVATAPVLALLYDRTFLSGSFAAAWRRRRILYLVLAATWVPLAWLVATTDARGGSAGFATDISPWHYLLTQARALVLYLKLSVWPHPLVLDYGTATASGPAEVWWQGLIVLTLLAATIWALVRRPVWGFAGAWFFVTLAPSSSFVPVATQTVAEHRMYLPLAALAVMAAAGLAVRGRRGMWAGAMLVLALAGATVARNADYRSALALWTANARDCPANARAHYNLSLALNEAGRTGEALAALTEAVRLKPDFEEAQLNLGNALAAAGRRAEARAHYEASLRARPDYAEAHVSLGYWFASEGRLDEAVACYERALRLRPDYAEAHNNLGEALARLGRPEAAAGHFDSALQAKPDYAEAHSNLAGIRLRQGQAAAAVHHAEEAVRLKPALAEARINLAGILLQLGRPAEALPHAAEAVRLQPDLAEARANLAYALLQTERFTEAATHYRELLRLEPDNLAAHANLGYALWRIGQTAEAAAEYETVLRLDPENAMARDALRRLRR